MRGKELGRARLLGTDLARLGVYGVRSRRVRAVLDHYPDRMAVGEVWVFDDERLAQVLDPRQQLVGQRLALAIVDAVDLQVARVEHQLAGRGALSKQAPLEEIRRRIRAALA